MSGIDRLGTPMIHMISPTSFASDGGTDNVTFYGLGADSNLYYWNTDHWTVSGYTDNTPNPPGTPAPEHSPAMHPMLYITPRITFNTSGTIIDRFIYGLGADNRLYVWTLKSSPDCTFGWTAV